MVNFAQYGTAEYANQVADKLSGFNLPENIAARRNVQIGQQANEMKLRQMQQAEQERAAQIQQQELAKQAWQSAIEEGKATGKSPLEIYQSKRALAGPETAMAAQEYQQQQIKANLPTIQEGQMIRRTPEGGFVAEPIPGFRSEKLETQKQLAQEKLAAQREAAQMRIDQMREAARDRFAQQQDMARLTASLRQPNSEAPPKAQPGTRIFKDESGNWQSELIPNQPAWQKAKSQYAQDTAAVTNAAADADKLAQRAEALANHPGLAGNFGMRGYVPSVRGSEAANAEVLLSELKDSMQLAGFGALRSTSGSPGAMTEKEWPKLEAAIAKLQNASDVGQARSALAEISTYAKRIKSVASSAYDNEWGGSQFMQQPRQAGGDDLHSQAEAILKGR